MSSSLGTLVVRIAAQLAGYKADLSEAAKATQDAAGNIDTASQKVSTSTRKGFGEAGAAAEQSAQKVVEASSRQVSAMDAVKDAAKTLGLTYAAYKVADQIRDMTMLAARYQELGVVMAVVGRNAGYNAQEMEQAALGMQKQGITMTESRNTAIQLAQAQIDLADASKLARIAQDAAVIGNINSSEALASMVHGIKTAQTDVLRTIGINVNFEQSYKDLAQELGTTTEALSEKQKMQARENAVVDEGTKLMGAYEAAMDTAGKQMRSMTRYFEDLKVIKGEVFNEALTVAVMAFTGQLKDANKEVSDLAKNGALREWGNDVADTFAFVVDAGLSVINVTKMIGATVGWMAARAANGNTAGTTREQLAASAKAIDDAYLADLDRLRNGTSAMRDALANRRAAHAQTAASIATTEQRYLAAQLAVQKAYAHESVAVQRAAQLALAKGFYAASYPNKPADAPAAAGKPKAEKISEYEKLSDAMARQLNLADEELKYGGKLSASDKFRVQTLDTLQDAYADNKITMREWSDLYDKTIKTSERMAEVETVNKVAKANLAAAEAHGKYVDSLVRGLDKMQQDVAAQQESNDRLGLGKEAIAALDAAKLESQAVTLDLLAIKTLDKNMDEAQYNLYRAQAEELRKLAALKGQGAAKEAAVDAAKASAEAWQKGWEDTDRLSREVFSMWVDEGDDAAKKIGDSLKTALKSAIYDATLRPLAFQIYSSVTGMGGPAGAANALGSAGNMFQTGSTMASMFPAATAAMSQFGTAALASTQSLIGLTGTAAQATAAVNAGLAAQTGASTMMASLGNAVPYIAAAYIAYKVLSGGETRSGATYDTVGGLANLQQGPSGGEIQGEDARKLFDATQASIVGVLKAVGSRAALTGFTAGLESSDNGKGFNFAGGYVGGVGFGESGGRTGGQFDMRSQSSEQAFARYKTELGQSIIEALQVATDVPRAIHDMLAGINASDLSTEATDALLLNINNVVTGVNQFSEAVKAMPFDALKTLSFDAAAGLIAAAGGLDKLGANLAGYYDNFYSSEEKRAQQIENINAALSGTGFDASTATRDQFRALVEAQDLTTDAGQAMYASLLSVAGAFAGITPAVEAATRTVDNAAEALAKTNQGWQDQLDLLTGAQTERSIALRDATAESTRALMLQVYAQEDLAAALETSTQAAIDATQGSMTDMVAMFGDLGGAMVELNPSALSLVDTWRATKNSITDLTRGLAEALGELPPPTALDNLRATLGAMSSAARGMDAINSQIYDLQTGTGDQAAVELMRSREAALFAELATSADPGKVSAELASNMMRRIGAEAALAAKGLDDVARLEKDSRDAQIKGLQGQISAAERLVDFAQSLKGFVAELQFSDLSALNPGDQLSAAQANFDSLFGLARGGDAKAQGSLQSSASAYLQEAQGYYGGATSQYADIYARVVGQLGDLSMTPVTDISLMTDQLAALQSIESTTVEAASTTREQITALQSIREVLGAREAELSAQADRDREAVQAQIDLLKTTVANQEAQIRQQAEIYDGLSRQLEEQTAALDRLATAAETEAAAP